MKAKWMAWLLAMMFAGLTVIGCQKISSGDKSENESKAHLRSALIALDNGDEHTAESELKASLRADPLNSRARTTLASLYARQGGLSLKDWLDPFWEAGRQLSGRVRSYQRTSEIIGEVTGNPGELWPSDQQPLSEEERTIRDRVMAILGDGAKIAIGASAMLEVFQALPFLSDDQLVKLDQAISVLRDYGVAATSRAEEERVYLAVLSFVRLVNHIKRLIGDQDAIVISFQRQRLCTMKPEVLKEHLEQIRLSLQRLEEGLTITEEDPKTSQREARRKVQDYITKSLISPIWDDLDSVFDPATLEGKAAAEATRIFCSKIPKANPAHAVAEVSDEYSIEDPAPVSEPAPQVAAPSSSPLPAPAPAPAAPSPSPVAEPPAVYPAMEEE